MNKNIVTALLLVTSGITPLIGSAQTTENVKPVYGKNLLTVSPIALTEQGVALGITYERALDDKDLIHFSLPVFYTFDDVNGNDYFGGSTTSYLSAYPGIKIYPTGFSGKVRYSVGPALQIAYGRGTYYNSYYGDANRLLLGMMVANALNVQFTPHYYLGTEIGLGISYINRVDGYNDGTMALTRLSFSFGYRF